LRIRETLITHLELQIRDYGTEVGVTASFSETVYCPLNLAYSQLYGYERIGNSQIRVVVAMDAKRCFYCLLNHFNSFGNFMRKGPAICIAKNQTVSPCISSGLQGFDRKLRIRLISIKKVFRIIKDLVKLLFQEGHGLINKIQIFPESYLEGLLDMEVPALPEDTGNTHA
jgi:hypothetical protein